MRRRSQLGHIVVIFGLLAACGGKDSPRVKPKAESPITAERLDDLTSLAVGTSLEPAKRTAILQQLAAGTLTLESYVHSLVQQPAFSREIAPHILLGWLNIAPYVYRLPPLSMKEIDGVPVYFLRTPCALADAVDVNPWWDRGATLKICKANYRPEVRRDPDGRLCSGMIAAYSPPCGCGANLVNCAKDKAHSTAVSQSLISETRRTIGYVIENDRPLKDVFTTNYSFRDRNIENVYARDQIFQGTLKEVPDLSAWPEEGMWAPRHESWPGAHSGILTNRQLVWMGDAPRDRMSFYHDRAWCQSVASFGVDVDVFDKLVHDGAADLRAGIEGWKQLAAMPGCTSCHARMDYGAQAFTAFLGAYDGMTETPETSRHAERGPMYSNDIQDPRGTAALTPRGFGEMLVAQEEFSNCMVQRVEHHVLGIATPAERAELRQRFQVTGRMRTLFETALKQFALRSSMPRVAPLEAPVTPQSVFRAGGAIRVSDRLVQIVKDNCQECHMEPGTPLGFLADFENTKRLDRDQWISIGNLVAFGLMPKAPATLLEGDRHALLVDIVRAVAPSSKWAENATAYWLGEGFQPSRTHFIGAVRNRIAMEAGSTAGEQPYVLDESMEEGQLTLHPGLLMQVGQLAVSACKGKPEPERRDCLVRATRPDVVLVAH